jgi:serine protease
VQARDVWDSDRDGTVDAGAPTGAGRTVCVIDSGLFTEHQDLDGVNVLGGYPSNWYTDTCGHGTHVAGTIAAANNALGVVGVTPGAVNLYIVKVFGDNCAWTYSSTLADAANRCNAAGADVISMSLGGAKSSRLEQTTFNNLYTAGVLSIAAAGNEGTSAVSYPAGYSTVVSVAAIDQNKAWADFSQFNTDVELAAPGVGVLSTLPYIDTSALTVDGVTYDANHIEYAARGAASGALVDGGLCGIAGTWAGKVVLCQRGTYDFYTKVMSVQNGGGVAAVVYNNESGNFLGTLGEGNSSTIPAISLSLDDGLFLVANKLDSIGAVSTSITWGVSGYEAWDGTSMATPHVSGVAALVWSANPAWTNVQIRDALNATAMDLGAAGRDVYYGYGLVQAKAALDSLGGGTPPPTGQLNVTLATDKATYANRQTVYITTTVKDQAGAVVASAAVSVKITTPKGTVVTKTCTTSTTGTCTVSWKVDTRKYGTGTYNVVSTATKEGYDAGTGSTTFLVQ